MAKAEKRIIMHQTKNKKVAVIGAGIAGMTAGIYLLDNGYDVEIFEKHFVPGGQCTGWTRDGTFIDGCAHWIVGTNPNSDLFPLWKHVGAFDENTKIVNSDYFSKYNVDGETVTFYADVDKLHAELLRVAPEDEKIIGKFIAGIKSYMHVRVPTDKPVDYMNLFELIKFGWGMLPMVPTLMKYKKISSEDFAKQFKSPILKEVIARVLDGDYNVHSVMYVFQALSLQDAGMVEGGSKNLALRIADRFKSLGGKLNLSTPVQKIIVEKNAAKGLLLCNGRQVDCDYVVCSADAHHTLYDLLEGKYRDRYFEERFAKREDNPLNTCVFLSYRYDGNKPIDDKINFEITPYNHACLNVSNVTVRSHAFDTTLNENGSTMTVIVPTTDEFYDYLRSCDKESYKAFKQEIGNHVKGEIEKFFGIGQEEITLLDVATPLTYERYTNAYRGSYMSFITTARSKGLMRKGLIKGLKNLVLAGQWIMSPGGLPIALFSGKHAACRICKADGKKFLCLEQPSAKKRKKAIA